MVDPSSVPPDFVDALVEEFLVLERTLGPIRALAELYEHRPQDALAIAKYVAGIAKAIAEDPALLAEERFMEFEIQETLRSRGVARVYKARHITTGQLVALKVLPQYRTKSEQVRFAREVSALKACTHPSIPRILQSGAYAGMEFLATEWVEGHDLRVLLEKLRAETQPALELRDLRCIFELLGGEPPSAERPQSIAPWPWFCVSITRQVASALSHVHGLGIVHRDVKPSNIIVTPTGKAVLVDYGLALDAKDAEVTVTRAQVGTLAYMAPEQVLGNRARIGPGTDVHGLGVTLYEMLTDIPPFVGSHAEVERAILTGHVRFLPRSLNPSVPRDLELVCLKAMDPSGRRRYADARALESDLQRLEHGEAALARPLPAYVRLLRMTRWAPVWSMAILASGIVALSLALVAFTQAEAREKLQLRYDQALAADLLREEEELWPVLPEMVSGPVGMREWLARAEGLASRLPRRRAELEAVLRHGDRIGPVEARASVNPGEYLSRTRRVDALDAELQRIGKFVANGKEPMVEKLRTEIAELQAELAEIYAWRFEDQEIAAAHTLLARTLYDSARVVKRIPSVRARLVLARSMEKPGQAPWAALNERLTTNPRYQGLRLSPQVDLLPLGPDPDSHLEEFAHLPSGAPAERDSASGKLALTIDTGLVLVLIPRTEFQLGATSRPGTGIERTSNFDPHARADESPLHRVALDPFFLSKYELTQAQWERVTRDNPSLYRPPAAFWHQGARLPVTKLHPLSGASALECAAVLRKLHLELPSEAQWECAARGGTTTPWWTGTAPESVRGAGNVRDVAFWEYDGPHEGSHEEWDDGFPITAPVGTFAPNPFGLHDVIGNVAEICADGGAYDPATATPGTWLRWARANGPHAMRGGSYAQRAADARSASRPGCSPDVRDETAGVRPARRVLP